MVNYTLVRHDDKSDTTYHEHFCLVGADIIWSNLLNFYKVFVLYIYYCSFEK